ncbi:MAG: hypothetical protein ACHQF2_07245 [Flavobacteriales bacterium]
MLGVAILISVQVSVLSGLLLTRAQYYYYLAHQYDLRETLVRNSKSGIIFLLSSQSMVLPGEKKTIDLFGNESDSVELTRKPWGGYEIIVSRAFSKNKHVVKTALVGQTSKADSLRTSLYLCDMDRPLSVCGATRLDGKLFLPKAGIKRAYIEGQNYTGDKLMYGNRFDSGRNLPAFNKELIESNKAYLQVRFPANDSVVNVDGIRLPDSVSNSFANKTLVLYSTGSIHVNLQALHGNVIVVAHKIVLSQRTSVLDVLFYANEIIVPDDFEGSFQAFASESITIGKNCRLKFPMVLAAFHSGNKKENDLPSIYIGEGTEITGEIICYDEKYMFNKERLISIDRNVNITGEVYINGLLDLKGNVFGSVYCHRFMMKTPSSVYENHLLNSEINSLKLPKYFTGVNLLATENKRAIVRWI